MGKDEKNQEILRAATKCFGRYGYDKTTLDDIGKLVGLNKASLYYYYKNKESIFRAVLLDEMQQFLSAANENLENITECRERILTYFEGRFQFTRNLANLNNLTFETFQKNQSLFFDVFRETNEMESRFLEALIQRCIDDGELKDCDAARVSQSLIDLNCAMKNAAHVEAEYSIEHKVDLDELMDNILFTTGLILDGLVTTRQEG